MQFKSNPTKLMLYVYHNLIRVIGTTPRDYEIVIGIHNET